ncbi:hypothetical protein ACJJTC_000704 [Scirpophaga incertulas]
MKISMGRGKLNQSFTALASSYAALNMGMLYVWPSYTVSMFRAQNTTILSAPMTESEISLLGSLPSLGAMLGSGIAGIMIEKFGRKNGSLAMCLPLVLSWSMVMLAKSSMLMLISRLIGGVAGGANLVFAPIFISEVAEDSIRGTLASGPVFLYGVGTLLSYLCGWFFSYITIVWINLTSSVLCCILLLSVTESPVYLLKNKREEEARNALATYRGLSAKEVQDELTRLKQRICPEYEMVPINEKVEEPVKVKLSSENASFVQKMMSSFKSLFLSPAPRKAFLIVFAIISMQVLMGIVPVQVYAKNVFETADPSQADLYSVIFAVILVIGTFMSGVIADKAGRRILVISSSVMVALCMGTLGYLMQTKTAPPLVTVAMILLYCFSFMFGAGSMPYVLLAEVFTTEVQALASTLLIEWVWFLNFLILVVFNGLLNIIGIHGIFYIFAVSSIINTVLGFFIVPETKGLSNAQIQDILLKGRRCI